MSVIKAILFYSKHDQKSLRMKKVVDAVGADLETVCVDPLEIRERLLEDDKYGITEVPAVLLIYSSGQHKTYSGKSLDQWFEKLIVNIQQEEQARALPQQAPMSMTEVTPITFQEPIAEPVYDTNVPKPLRRKPGDVSDIRGSLPSPGRELTAEEMSAMTTSTGITIPGAGSLPIAGGEIGQMIASTIQPEDTRPTPKGVKKEGLSARELAEQMKEQREKFEETVEQNKPFI